MKTKETFLQLHERITRSGIRNKHGEGNGLCYQRFNNEPLVCSKHFQLFIPNEQERESDDSAYWAGDGMEAGEYSPTRQNIILLCAALNGEL